MYSGPVASHSYYALAEDGFPESFIIIGPNHTGHGSPVSLGDDDFETPLGGVTFDRELASTLENELITVDGMGHKFEHSIEVQLPFLQSLSEQIKFVPITLMAQDMDTALAVGKRISEVIDGKDVVVIASTDFSHYITRDSAKRLDGMVLDKIIAGDVQGMYDVIMEHSVSMCGYGPVAAMLAATQANADGKGAKLLKYATSGDVQPMREVVGYGALVVR
jgi:AmmeMemoRadiSam system protein B